MAASGTISQNYKMLRHRKPLRRYAMRSQKTKVIKNSTHLIDLGSKMSHPIKI